MGEKLKLGQILVKKEMISPEQLAAALGEQERWGSRLGMTLVRMGFLEEEELIRVLAAQLRLPVARIRGKSVNSAVLELVPVDLAEKHRCLPLFVREEGGAQTLFLAMEDPSDLQVLDDLSFRIGQKLRPVLVGPAELEDALTRHYHGAALMGTAEGLPPVSVAQQAPESEESVTAPELPPLDPVFPTRSGTAALASEPGAAVGSLPGSALDPTPEPVFGAPAAKETPRSLEPRVILRALAQLLVEKGIITRDELAERVRSVGSQERS